MLLGRRKMATTPATRRRAISRYTARLFAYIHRIGRTGRAARSGDAYTLVAGEDTDMVRDIERVLGGPVERRTVAGFDYSAVTTRKDSEFGRPPRQHMPARRPERTSKTARQWSSAYQPKTSSTKKDTPKFR